MSANREAAVNRHLLLPHFALVRNYPPHPHPHPLQTAHSRHCQLGYLRRLSYWPHLLPTRCLCVRVPLQTQTLLCQHVATLRDLIHLHLQGRAPSWRSPDLVVPSAFLLFLLAELAFADRGLSNMYLYPLCGALLLVRGALLLYGI